MNSNQALHFYLNPLVTWNRLAWKIGTVAFASAQVIGHRTSRLALAGAVPSARDQREIALMGQEKGEAALQAAEAAGVGVLMLSQQFAALALKQMMSASIAAMSIAASRTAAEASRAQLKFLRDTMSGSVAAASTLSGSAAEVARRALNPVHARLRGNVKRLGRKSK